MQETKNWAACADRVLAFCFIHNGRQWSVQKIFDHVKAGKVSPAEAQHALASAGLGLLLPGEIAPMDAGYVLAVPNSSPLVAKIFARSDWAAADGLSGLWRDALRQAPAGVVVTGFTINRVRIAGVRYRCSLVLIARVREEYLAA